jgi:hypothetical protein
VSKRLASRSGLADPGFSRRSILLAIPQPVFDFPDESASLAEVEAAVRADPVLNAWRIRSDVGRTRNWSESLRVRARVAAGDARRLRDELALRRFLFR